MTTYKITEAADDGTTRTHVVVADSQAQAFRHVMGKRLTAEAVSSDELADLVIGGAKPERAKSSEAEQAAVRG